MRALKHALFCLISVGVLSGSAAEAPQRGPFASVVVRGDTLVATFPSTDGRWSITLNSQPSLISTYNETITLRQGDVLVLAEHHCSSRVIPSFAAENPGLRITTTCHHPFASKSETQEPIFVPAAHQ